MPAGTYLRNALLNHLSRQAAYAMPAALEIGLSTADPLPDGSGIVEPPGASGYARVNSSSAWGDAAVAGEISNTVDLVWAAASADWPQVTHWFEVDGSGNLLYYGALDTPKTVQTADVFRLLAGTVTKSLEN